jgi:hypothetical protein
VQTQVAQALDQVVTRDSDADTKDAAMDALTVWATKDDVPALVGLLDDPVLKDRVYDLLIRFRPSRISPLPSAQGRSDGGSEVCFGVHVHNDNRERTPPLVRLKAVCGPGDQGEPVVTVMFPA